MMRASNLTSQSKSGFTLIELLVVIAIIGILSSVVLASLSGARESARVTRTASDLNQIETALTLWMQNTNRAQWPHPGNDLGIGQLTNGDYVPLETMANQTSLSEYLTSVPEPPFDGRYWYHNDLDHTNGECGTPHRGTNIDIRGSSINASTSEKIDKIIDQDVDNNCGRLRYSDTNGVYYSLSKSNSF